MYSVKVETEKNNICCGCLSTDRTLSLLKSHAELFYNLLVDQQIGDSKILLCWECRALLYKIHTFQRRVQRAQYILQQSFCSLNTTCEKLSTLTISNKDSYDSTIEYTEDEKKEIEKEDAIEISVDLSKVINESVNIEKPKRCKRSNNVNSVKNLGYEIPILVCGKDEDYEKLDIDIKKESEDELDSDFRIENDNDNDSTDDNNESYEKREEKRRLQACLDQVKVTDTDIDQDNLRNYCVRVTLNEKEIEDLLERDNNDIRPGMRRNTPYNCKDCKNAYRKEIDLKRHETFQHLSRTRSRYECKVCKKYCRSWELLAKHWETHNRHYRCTICGWTTLAIAGVIHHVETLHSKIYTCLICSQQFSNLKQFKKHYKMSHERIICDVCGKSFIKKRSLETHMKRHHLPPTCEICNRHYATYHNLENHYRLNHPEKIRGMPNNKELAYCVECNKQFPSIYKYRRHLSNAAIHTPPKIESVPCPECGKVFSRKIRMTNHVLSVHRKTTKHRCDICNKTFCSAYSARTHRQCVHEKIPMPKNKFCDICGRGFSTNRILANHRRTHTGERPYSCPHCPATFAQRVAMNTHAKTQHKNLIDILSEH